MLDVYQAVLFARGFDVQAARVPVFTIPTTRCGIVPVTLNSFCHWGKMSLGHPDEPLPTITVLYN